MPDPKNGNLEPLTDRNSALVLVDFQPTMFAGVGSGDKTIIRNAAFCAVKAARILNMPVVLSTIKPQTKPALTPRHDAHTHPHGDELPDHTNPPSTIRPSRKITKIGKS
ncbi:MAG: isochorismatase family protein [Methanoregulaceae archaeon]|nr:MAG: isochorismatase family protein [Methanoregulaceae archaeon]